MKNIIIIGGGAAGMMAAIFCSRAGDSVTLLEQNEKLGKKIFITGKGRCNITNACDMEELFQHMVSNEKFMYSSFYSFTNQDAIDFFNALGCKTKVERGNRVFPQSDKSSDVIHSLEKELQRNHVKVKLHTKVTDLLVDSGTCIGVKTQSDVLHCDSVIVATGGKSYESTGSRGDGYRFANKLGLEVVEPRPALVPVETVEQDILEMQGLALKNVEVTFYTEKKGKPKSIYKEFGEMLFTHFGMSGPIILSGSSYVGKYIGKEKVWVSIDCKPALSSEQLDRRILRDFEKEQNVLFKNSLSGLLPRTMIPVIIKRSGILPNKQVNLVTREERQCLVDHIKNFVVHISSLRGFREAIITQGGVKVKEINPSTMECKKINNLYFAGEVLDLDALTGGFNLQIAWSTAYLAASSIQCEDETPQK